ncbi:MAG: DUF1838 domain-containing protein [Steroidobacteraceae bacterium]|jgi:hypothetical protein|nr:DUF1838 domain-containing protein [Steroidobacteraceae bacterium]
MTPRISRRAALAGAGVSALVGAGTARSARAAEPAGARASRRAPLDLATPLGNVTAYLKMRASIETQDVYFWFTGRLDLAVPGEPVRPIIEVASLILRRTERVADLAWNVIDWEASMYRHLDGGAWLEADEPIVNPHTGRKVRPMPYREGPVRFRFTDQEPRIIGSRDVMPNTGKPFSYPWKVVGGDLYMVKSSYIRAPNWLQPVDWPLESSGKDVVVAAHSSLKSRFADVQDPRVASAPADFAYTATSGWLPWMQMGATPGHVVWAESGKKLFSLDEAPPDQVARLRQVHPAWFARPEPWPEFTNMYLQYKEKYAVR